MKRRVVSFITVLALCLSLCPTWASAAGTVQEDNVCPHHTQHTAACGYAAPKECTHVHNDGCYTAETACIHTHTAACYSDPDYDPQTSEPDLCTHACSEENGCIVKTLNCPHVEHDAECGYEPGKPCAYDPGTCRICRVDGLIRRLPDDVSSCDAEQLQAQFDEINLLYDALTADEQKLVDLSKYYDLQEQFAEDSIALMSEDASQYPKTDQKLICTEDWTVADAPHPVKISFLMDTNGYTCTAEKNDAFQVFSNGKLYLVGTFVAKAGAVAVVDSGGFFSVFEPGTTLNGRTYALNISAGATVQLSAGTYTGRMAAIKLENDDYASLLAPGCAFFVNGLPVDPGAVKTAKTVTVGPCTDQDHLYRYTPDSGAPTHSWICAACDSSGSNEPCTFVFADGQNTSTCNICRNEITIDVNRDSLKELAYDETIKPKNGTVTVTVQNSATPLTENNYNVSYSTQAVPGSTDVTVTVTVEGKTYNGTYTNSYTFNETELIGPVLKWESDARTVNYDGAPVEKTDLPTVTIKITPNDGLDQYLQYSYRTSGGDPNAPYIAGLPTNAGTYDVIVTLPEQAGGHEAVSSKPLILTISKLDPIKTSPAAITLHFNRQSQALVTAGELKTAAAADGAVILFASSVNGPYSTSIPTGIDAKDYTVWYKVEETANCNAEGPTKVNDVKIQRKQIEPTVELEYNTIVYDGGKKEPKVTVKDPDGEVVLSNTEYGVAYTDNQNVGTAKVTVSDKANGNYEITETEATFQITKQPQQTALSIGQKPDKVVYGDVFTLNTSGGTGNGEVTWEITSGADVAQVVPNSGQVKIIGVGTATVTATKSGMNNYNDATDTWTFKAVEKSVIAIVTAKDKTYDGGDIAKVDAVVPASELVSGDSITISGLTGTFSDANAGVDKTVTVDTRNASVGGTNSTRYKVSYSSLTVKSTINKAKTAVTPPTPANLTYDGSAQDLITAAVVTSADAPPPNIQAEYALSQDGPYSTDLPKGTLAGNYTVWYRVPETINYLGIAPASIPVTIAKKQVTPVITLAPNSCTYDGTEQKPVVTLQDGTDGPVIPADEYTAAYSNNINAGQARVTVTAKADGNYQFSETEDFTIGPKSVTPTIELSSTSYVYDTTKKNPQITVRDGQTVIPDDQYTVAWTGNDNQAADDILRVVGKYTVTISSIPGKNYTFSGDTKVAVEILPATQTGLTITGKPTNVYYGDTIQLDTTGGTGDGTVKWTVTPTTAAATTDTAGKFEIRDIGSITVKAEREVDNYGTVSDSWTFTVKPKPVTAVVTITAKVYDGTNAIVDTAITASVNSSDLVNPSDIFTITGVTGTYDDANVGTNKKVSLDHSNTVTTADFNKYTISYPAIATADITPRQVDVTVTLSDHDLKKTDADEYYYIFDNTEKKPNVTVTGTDANSSYSATLAPSDYTVTYANNKNVGNNASVTVTAKAGGNYTFTAPPVIFRILDGAAVLTSTPQAKDLTYDGTSQDLVTVGTATGGTVWYSSTGVSGSFGPSIPQETRAGTYTVYYMVKGDENHADTAPGQVSVTIKPKEIISPEITVSGTYTYSGTAQEPGDANIEVKDNGATIDSTEYRISYLNNINAGTAKVIITSVNGSNYIVNGTATFEIAKATPEFTRNPASKPNLRYNGTAQELVTEGVTDHGTVLYSVNGGNYSSEIPKATAVGTYTIKYRIQGDANHNDTEPVDLSGAAIAKNTVNNPTITLSSETFKYNGSQQKPAITVYDDNRCLIPENEYVVTFTDGNMVDVGTYTVTVTTPDNSNYIISSNNTKQFQIVAADPETLSITNTKAQVYYGDVIQLGTSGGIAGSTVTWTVTDPAGASDPNLISSTGRLTVNRIDGPFTVTAERSSSNYGTISATWVFTVEKKPVTAELTGVDKPYDGKRDAVVKASINSGDLAFGDTFTIPDLTGLFDDVNAGTAKKITVDSTPTLSDPKADNYSISYPATATASIYKVDAKIAQAPQFANLTYTGTPQNLVQNPGTTEGGIGEIVYSLSQYGEYSTDVPKATNAGTYSVWYKVEDSINYTGVPVASHEVVISKAKPDSVSAVAYGATGQSLSDIELQNGNATLGGENVPGVFSWKDGSIIIISGTSYDAVFTPTDISNYDKVSFQVQVTDPPPENNSIINPGDTNTTPVTKAPAKAPSVSKTPAASSTPITADVSNGTASTTLDTATGSKLVAEAAASQSKNLVIKPEITGSVTKTSVSIPAATVSQLQSETEADLTVSTPIADVTIPSAALSTLSAAGGTVDVVTEYTGNTVALTLTANGETVEQVPGGVTLAVPAENAGPGTVAVLVHDDGTRETIPKSVVDNGVLNIPLDGTATIEIVDNSKSFEDVPETDWAADAVAFTSARELFNGTSDTTFSPNEPMSRGMLAAVLYNLEGRPDQTEAGPFRDVSSDAWYADGVAWAAQNGIVNGDGSGEFNPDADISREQFAVMLWKYAGSPEASGEDLDFTDAGEANDYAAEALRWAVSNGIMSGYGDGKLDPQGTATRAQAAQMLKNFLENT